MALKGSCRILSAKERFYCPQLQTQRTIVPKQQTIDLAQQKIPPSLPQKKCREQKFIDEDAFEWSKQGLRKMEFQRIDLTFVSTWLSHEVTFQVAEIAVRINTFHWKERIQYEDRS